VQLLVEEKFFSQLHHALAAALVFLKYIPAATATHLRLSHTLYQQTMCEVVKNSVPSGFDAESNLGLNLVLTKKGPPQGEWTEVVRCKSKMHIG
jgi:hypothetical protein